VNNLIAASGVISASSATGAITIVGTDAVAHSGITTGTAADSVTITNGAGDNAQTITTNAGNDVVTLTGVSGTATVSLGDGNDTLLAATGAGTYTGGAGSDSMTAAAGTDTFAYSSINDSTGATRDTLTSFAFGTDIIQLSTTMTSATFDATTATSTAKGYNYFTASTNQLTVLTDEGTLAVDFASATNAPAGSGTMPSSASIAYNVTGSGAGDTITLGAGADTVTGGAGADRINAGTGNDVFKLPAATHSLISSISSEVMPHTTTDVYYVNVGDTIDLAGASTGTKTLASVATTFNNTVTTTKIMWARGTYNSTTGAYWDTTTGTTANQSVILVGAPNLSLTGDVLSVIAAA
jgi:Ca2+-binding RTX toxin-like protein